MEFNCVFFNHNVLVCVICKYNYMCLNLLGQSRFNCHFQKKNCTFTSIAYNLEYYKKYS